MTITTPTPERKPFSQEYYREILGEFKKRGYRSATMAEYTHNRAEFKSKTLILRHDVDARMDRVPVLFEPECELGFKATYFFRVHADYNLFFCDNYEILQNLKAAGMELGLHANFVEFAHLFTEDAVGLLKREKKLLEMILDQPVKAFCPHRNINYLKNSLPLLETLSMAELGFDYHAYQPHLISSGIVYINEGLSPHLCWRNKSPEEVYSTGENVMLFTHPHWWHRRHPQGR